MEGFHGGEVPAIISRLLEWDTKAPPPSRAGMGGVKRRRKARMTVAHRGVTTSFSKIGREIWIELSNLQRDIESNICQNSPKKLVSYSHTFIYM